MDEAPFARIVDVVSHDMGTSKSSISVEDLGGSNGLTSGSDVEVVDGGRSDDTQSGVVDPVPEFDLFRQLALLQLLLSSEVVDLDDGTSGRGTSSASNSILVGVHEEGFGLHVSSVHLEVLANIYNDHILRYVRGLNLHCCP